MSNKITVNDNGPLKIEGSFELCDGAGSAFGLGEKKVVFLCRCGQS
jgi:CDGSH-type Zn-finger protein